MAKSEVDFINEKRIIFINEFQTIKETKVQGSLGFPTV